MARRIAARIDNDPARQGFEHARQVCARWVSQGNVPAREWMAILQRPWPEVREILLDDSEEGRRLRQNDPFCGILTPVERWEIYREAARELAQAKTLRSTNHPTTREAQPTDNAGAARHPPDVT
jgi:hypothetical protein